MLQRISYSIHCSNKLPDGETIKVGSHDIDLQILTDKGDEVEDKLTIAIDFLGAELCQQFEILNEVCVCIAI